MPNSTSKPPTRTWPRTLKTSTLFAPPSLPPQPQLCSSQTTRFAVFLHVSSALNDLLSSTVMHRAAEKATGKYWQGRMHRRSLGGVRFCQNTLGSCFSAHPLRRTGTFPDPAAETRRVVDGPCAFASSDGRPFPFFACSTRKWWLDISHHNHMFPCLAVSISSFQSSCLHKRLRLLLQTSSRLWYRITVSAMYLVHIRSRFSIRKLTLRRRGSAFCGTPVYNRVPYSSRVVGWI